MSTAKRDTAAAAEIEAIYEKAKATKYGGGFGDSAEKFVAEVQKHLAHGAIYEKLHELFGITSSELFTVANHEPPRKGRPHRMPKFLRESLRKSFTEAKSDRQLRDISYMTDVASWISKQDGLSWLADIATGHVKRGLLTELGRMKQTQLDWRNTSPWTDEEVLEVARQLCQWKPTVKEGIARLRQMRLGRPAQAPSLLDKLIKVADAHQRMHKTPWLQIEADVIELLQSVRRVVVESGELDEISAAAAVTQEAVPDHG